MLYTRNEISFLPGSIFCLYTNVFSFIDILGSVVYPCPFKSYASNLNPSSSVALIIKYDGSFGSGVISTVGRFEPFIFCSFVATF